MKRVGWIYPLVFILLVWTGFSSGSSEHEAILSSMDSISAFFEREP